MLHTLTHPISGTVIKPLGFRKNGAPIWPVMGASEPATEPVISVPVTPEAPAPQTFTQEDLAAALAKARQEEKDKLYGKISSFEERVKSFETEIEKTRREAEEKAAAAAEEARKEAEEAARKQWEESDSKTLLQQAQQEWEQKFQTLNAEREQERALFAKEQEFASLQTYAQQKVQAALAANEIAPELADFVSGNNQAEIDASLDFVKAKSEAIVQNIAAAQVQARSQMRGVSTAGYSTTGPMDTDSGHKTYTQDDLKNLSMSEYAKIRGSLLPGLSAQQQNRGLYG